MLGFREWMSVCLAVALCAIAVTAPGCSSDATAQAANQGQKAAASAGGTTGQSKAKAQPAAETPESPEAEEDEERIAVRVARVARQSVSALYNTSGTLRADKQATVTARTHGVVYELLVEEGDWVKQGQRLAILENDEQQINFDKAATTRDTKLREYERSLKLHEQGLVSDEAFETIRRESEESRHSAALTELELERTVIRAPFGGRILRRHIDAGATVSNGTAVYDVADLSPLYADVDVPEREIVKLTPGQQVRLSVEGRSSTPLAKIERIAPLVDPTTGTVKVTLAVPQAPGLRPGSFVRVDIVTDTHDSALVVPRSALVAEGRRWHLFRVDDDGVAQRLEVVRGYEEQDRVEILEVTGPVALQPDDAVVVVGAKALTDGAKLQVIEDPADDGTDRVGP